MGRNTFRKSVTGEYHGRVSDSYPAGGAGGAGGAGRAGCADLNNDIGEPHHEEDCAGCAGCDGSGDRLGIEIIPFDGVKVLFRGP